MKRRIIQLCSIIMAAAMLISIAAADSSPQTALDESLRQLAADVPSPEFGTTAGEWTVLCLARGAYYGTDSKYFSDYYSRIEKTVAETAASVNQDGKLHKVKSTENSRLIIALSSIGRNAENVAGINLVAPLDDFKWLTKQGLNGPVFALIALDSAGYDSQVRQQCVDYILSSQLSDGGWALSGSVADPDMTSMALQALVTYRSNPAVESAAERGFSCLSSIQQENGGYSSWGSINSESIAQVIVACTAWGIDPNTDSRFVKNASAIDALMEYYVEDSRGFAHVLESTDGYSGGEVNCIATDQACYALVSYVRFLNGQTSLYDMSDVSRYTENNTGAENGTPEKNPDSPVSSPKPENNTAPDKAESPAASEAPKPSAAADESGSKKDKESVTAKKKKNAPKGKTIDEEANYDVNGDGVINAQDAVNSLNDGDAAFAEEILMWFVNGSVAQK